MTHRTAAASQDVARKIAVAAAAALGLLVAAGPATGPLATALAVEPGSVQTPGPNGQPYPAVPANGPYPNAPAGQPYPTPPATDGTGAPVASPDLVPAGPTAAPQPMVPTQGGATSTAGPVSGPMSGPISGPMSGAMSGPATRPAGVAAPAGDPVIRVSAGRSVIVRLPRLGQQTQSVDPGVAGVAMQPEPSDGRSMVVTGRKGGTTTLLVLDDTGRTTSYDVSVEPDFSALRTQLKEQFPGVAVQATPMGDSIGLRGLVPSDKVAAQMNEVAGAYAGKVHNFLEVAGGQQVLLQIRFAEVDRSAIRNFGFNFGGTDGVSTFGNNIGQVNPLGFIQQTSNTIALGVPNPGSGVQLFGTGGFGRTAFAYYIQALEENGLVRMLAEPNVVAINGQQASFVAGGSFPVPVSQGGGTGAGAAVTVDYKEYGIKLNFTPLVLGNGQIRLKVAPEVSQLDYANAIRANGFQIPALTNRKVSTTVELGDGQSFALAGLLSDTTSSTTDAVPLLGDIPVLGMLFRSTRFQRQQTELVVLVTPRLVGPTEPDTTAALPGEHWRHPTDIGAYFLHDLGGNQREPAGKDGRPGADKSLQVTVPPRAFHGTYGFTPNGTGSVGN